MLVALQNEQVPKYWDIFKEVIRKSIPTDASQLPDRLNKMLYASLTGRLQLWFMYDDATSEDDFYGALITKKQEDDLTGQKALLVYAFYNWRQASRATRDADALALLRIAKGYGCAYVTGYCASRLVAETMIKCTGRTGEIINYVIVPTEGV